LKQLEENVQKENKINSNAMFLCLCNLNVFGLGYLFAGLKKRWVIAMAGNLALLALGFVLNASRQPVIWAVIFGAVFIGMAVDIWLLIKKDDQLIPAKLISKAFVLPLVSIAILLTFIGAFFGYRAIGNGLIERGEEAYEANDFQAAYKQLFTATRLCRLSLNPQLPANEALFDETRLLVNVQRNSDRGHYARALEAAEEFYENYPDSPMTASMNDLAVTLNLALANDALEAADAQACRGYLEAIQTDFPDEAAEQQDDINEVNARYSQIVARDSGSAGAAIIEQARQMACEQSEVTDQSVDIFPEEPGKAMFCSNTLEIELPAELIADIPGTFRYVVDFFEVDNKIASCDYYSSSGKHVLERWRHAVTVMVQAVKDEEDVVVQTFYGSSPDSCPIQYMFMSQTQKIYGDQVDTAEIEEWLISVIQ
jgi:hypothetical protein